MVWILDQCYIDEFINYKDWLELKLQNLTDLIVKDQTTIQYVNDLGGRYSDL